MGKVSLIRNELHVQQFNSLANVVSFGRIGRFVLRATFKPESEDIDVVAINDPFLDVNYMVSNNFP
jgi:hypothetical protein